ncbi:MAG: excinuclease ABC subunit UvrC [Acidobacteriota bacterium]|nr:excinuclease ABC subunit UvrC [Acidobacteriota bacterium]
MTLKRLRDKAARLPDKPGIYFFRDAGGAVVYIGKARSLRDRVKSYFSASGDDKVRRILERTADIDVILAGSEREAAFLESNYVRQHRPPFNLRLKDDKSFPFLKLTAGNRFPGISLSRKVDPAGSRTFGPFSPASRARAALRLAAKHFGLRTCPDSVFKGRKRPCLEHDLGLCSAPCTGVISESAYAENVADALLFLEGRTGELSSSLKKKMDAASADQDFEQAARLRDLIFVLDDLNRKSETISTGLEDQDAAGFARSGGRAVLFMFHMRAGRVEDSRVIVKDVAPAASSSAVLTSLLEEAYKDEPPPPRLLLPFFPKPKRPFHNVPRSGRAKHLVDLASRNAEAALSGGTAVLSSTGVLAELLGLKKSPETIEGFDISHTGGEESVGSLVVFTNDRPDRKNYRIFRIRTASKSDDTAALAEVIRRRYSRILQENGRLPDLVFVDGGKGQLSAARKALARLGLDAVPVVSLAKREEIIFSAGAPNGLRLEGTSPALKLFQRIRDEAHRFAVIHHRKRREKKSLVSLLDGIHGIGPKRKQALLERFGSLEAVQAAREEDVAAIVGRKAARTLKAGVLCEPD